MRIVLCFTALTLIAPFWGVSTLQAATAKKKTATPKAGAATHAKLATPKSGGMAQAKTANKSHAAAARRAHPKTNSGKATGARSSKKPVRRTAATWRNRQLSPTPQRYKEIQTALASKGYLNPEDATGQWDQKSIDALKRFQAEQKITDSGKLNSLSIIALGLGPKYDANSAALRLGSIQQASN